MDPKEAVKAARGALLTEIQECHATGYDRGVLRGVSAITALNEMLAQCSVGPPGESVEQ